MTPNQGVPFGPWYRLGLVLAGILILNGCALVPGIKVSNDYKKSWYEGDIPPKGSEIAPRVHPVTPRLILEQEQARQDSEIGDVEELIRQDSQEPYRVGRRDALQVVVWNHPELTNPFGLTSGIEQAGIVVREDGTIFFPYVGTRRVAGLTVDEIRRDLALDLRPYIEAPQVDVRVAAFRSQRVYITGEVLQPGVFPITDVPMTVMDAINFAGGFNEVADRRLAVLTRDGRNYPVDMLSLYVRGENNFILRDGDVLHIQDNLANRVFVLGEVERQLIAPMSAQGRLTLMEAIGNAEGFDLTTANTGGVYIFRGKLVDDPKTGEPFIVPTIFHLDARNAVALILASRFQLEPRDIVFVSASGLVRYNRVIEQILPTVQFLFQTDRLVFN
ncbi:MAG: polysaccharide biosynthesis/export family protein [Aquisalimonadaceae bacterium]